MLDGIGRAVFRETELRSVTTTAAFHDDGGGLVWQSLGHLKTSEVGERIVRRIAKYLRRRGALEGAGPNADSADDNGPDAITVSAVSGQ